MIPACHINWSDRFVAICNKTTCNLLHFILQSCLLLFVLPSTIGSYLTDLGYSVSLWARAFLKWVSRRLSIIHNSHLQPCDLQVCGHVTWDSLSKFDNVVKLNTHTEPSASRRHWPFSRRRIRVNYLLTISLLNNRQLPNWSLEHIEQRSQADIPPDQKLH